MGALRERYCALDARLQRSDELDTCSSFVRSLVGSQPRLHARVKDRCLKYDEDDIEIVLDDYEAIARSVSRDRIK